MSSDKKFKQWIKKTYPSWNKRKIRKKIDKLQYKYNLEKCKEKGNKNNFYFYFNEYNINKNLLKNIKNFYELTEKLNQQQIKLGNDYPIKRTEGYFFYDIWARYIRKMPFISKKEILVYTDITSLENYIETVLNEYVSKLLNKYIPHFYLDKEFNQDFCSKVENKKYCIVNKSILKADGKEKLLERVKLSWYKKYYLQFFIPLIINACKKHNNKTFRIEKYKKYDYFVFEIIGGKEAAKNININNFLVDFHKLQQPEQIVKNIIKKLKKEVKNKIKEIISVENNKLNIEKLENEWNKESLEDNEEIFHEKKIKNIFENEIKPEILKNPELKKNMCEKCAGYKVNLYATDTGKCDICGNTNEVFNPFIYQFFKNLNILPEEYYSKVPRIWSEDSN